MKTNLRGLALTALLLSASNLSFAQQGQNSVGDLPGYDEDAYFADEATYQQKASRQVSYSNDYDAYEDDQEYETNNGRDVQPVGFVQQVGNGGGCGCGGGGCEGCGGGYEMSQDMSFGGGSCGGGCGNSYGSCDGGCGSYSGSCGNSCGGSRGLGLGSMFGCGSNTWAQTEALLWWTGDRDMPPLIATADPGQVPFGPNSTTVFGDDINGELSGGIRTDIGKYVSENVGIGGRFWILAENQDSFFGQGTGDDRSIGRPFFNTSTNVNLNGPDAFLVAASGVNGANFTGAIAAEDSLDILAAEGYGRVNLGGSRSGKLELIGGYTHMNIDNELRISSTSLNRNTGALTQFRDSIDMQNSFNGGQIGMEMSMTRGRWTARSLTKVHLGNMNQQATLIGASQFGPAGTTPALLPGGGLVTDNRGSFERDVFSFIPEANFKLGYRFRPNVSLSLGYSFLYVDNVALAGDVVDPLFDGATNATAGPFGGRPFKFDDSSLWVQGIDLGVIINL